ncbi:MAG: hypothetical protein WBI07_10525 [Mobilitalea sp.]
MAKIGFCIYNTSMAGYTINRQLKYFQPHNNVFIFHINELTKDRSNKDLCFDTQVNSFDLSFTSTRSIIDLIKSLEIDIFVFYTFQSQLDKLVWEICQMLKIPTILHDHGIVFGDKIAHISKFRLSYVRIKRKLVFQKKRMSLKKILRNTKFDARCLNNYAFSHYIIYSNNNYTYYSSFFHLNEKNVTITGIPLFTDLSEINSLRQINSEPKILFIYQPLRKFGMSSIDDQGERDFINSINDVALSFGLKLEIRLHPAQCIEDFGTTNWHENIFFFNSIDLESQAASASIILGHWSTALSISYTLNKPLIVLEFPKVLKEYLPYFTLFKKVGFYCSQIEQMNDTILKMDRNFNMNNNENWINLIGDKNTYQFDVSETIKIIDKLLNTD